MIKNYELFVFDWDGTLVDSIDWIVECIQQMAQLQDFELPTKQQCKDVIGLSLSQAMWALFPDINEEQKSAMVNAYRQKYMTKDVSEDDLFSDALPVLQELKNMNKTLAIATGKGQMGLDRSLDGTGIRSFFDYLRCAEKMQSKPSPHMLFDIMQESGVEPDKVLMIGDSTLDLAMAKNAGVASIGVTTGAHSYEVLKEHAPIACINNLSEIFSR